MKILKYKKKKIRFKSIKYNKMTFKSKIIIKQLKIKTTMIQMQIFKMGIKVQLNKQWKWLKISFQLDTHLKKLK